MGHQEIVAGSGLRRIIVVLVVAALMAAMIVAMASPAFAKGGPSPENCERIAIHARATGHGALPPKCLQP